MKYYVIGDEDTVLGFGLVGVDGKVASIPAEAESAFDEAIADSSVGILVITEHVADMMRSRVDKLLFSDNFPLIVEIPDRQGHDPSRPGIKELVNTAIGIKVG